MFVSSDNYFEWYPRQKTPLFTGLLPWRKHRFLWIGTFPLSLDH